MRFVASMIAGAALLLACSTAADAPVDAGPTGGGDMVSKYTRIEAQLEPAAKAVVEGVNAFSLDLYKSVSAKGGNQFLSPASVSLAMGLAYGGARGTTAEEIRTALHYPSAPDAFLPAAGPVLKSLEIFGEGRELKVANALWAEQTLKLQPDYLAAVDTHMGAGLRPVDFAKKSDASRKAINGWVEDRTNDRIKDLLQPGDVSAGTKSVLVNTVYWKGDWAVPFEMEDTRPKPFTPLTGPVRDVPMMMNRAWFQTAQRNGVKAIQMAYSGAELSMVVLLPDDPKGLPALEAKLTAKELTRWTKDLDNASSRETILWLPKIHMEARAKLKPALQGLGVRTAFSDAADFSGVTGGPDLKIDEVIHQTFLDVDEKGTEAAAATAVTMVATSAAPGPPPPPPFEFKADKPFLFMLRDMRTGLVLFIGRHVEPTKS